MRSAQILASSLVLSLGLGLGMSAFAQKSATESMDDAGTTARVKTALIGNKQAKASQINVETERGVVQLSGFVDSDAARQAAVATAKGVTGVKEVQDKLLIRDSRSTGEAVDDTVIEAKVKSELAGKSGLGTATDVIVEVNRGVVELSGFVPTLEQKTMAANIARGVSGVKDVQNNIELKPRG
jgi:hyperosmotically inducible protein